MPVMKAIPGHLVQATELERTESIDDLSSLFNVVQFPIFAICVSENLQSEQWQDTTIFKCPHWINVLNYERILPPS